MIKYLGTALAFSFLIWSCAGSKSMAKSVIKPMESDTMEETTEVRDLDTMEVTPDDNEAENEAVSSEAGNPYRSSYTRRWDLLHTSLILNFDWQKEHVLGKAKIKLVPLFYAQDSIELDAKTFDIHAISSNGRALNYTYTDDIITIRLGKPVTKKDTIILDIDYTAKPSENTTSGSAAITDDNGLYFIDPRNTDPSLPTQLWSQGETEYNSRWFPTIDKPNERMTDDITLTVPDSMLTLSNGLMTSSIKNNDGTRTDKWVMDQPHAPYLVMIAAGPFAKVSEEWNGIPVDYYVDKEYAPYAKEIFNHTPEMLTFFSEKLGVKYPWKKFSQIIVKKYVSGAMENTTAVVFGDFIQKTHRELIDDPNDYIIAHEMFHHWFGDYVTTESWSNLTLNEGFANYSEYLWNEYKYGKNEANRHREEELVGYLSTVSFGQAHDLIDFHYANKENMFDAHSYNKGGLILHMLRNYVGDDAFYASLNLYLKKHAYQSVEVHDLRLAFEEVTGEDLNWFFNQWFLDDGHPTLSYTSEYDMQSKSINLSFKQSQKNGYPHVFILPIDIDIHKADGTIESHRIWMNEREQEFSIPANRKPALVIVDPNRVLLTEWNEPELSAAEYKTMWKKNGNLQLRLSALSALTEDKDYASVWQEALQDSYWYIRVRALDYLPSMKESYKNLIKKIASTDPHSQVRAAAIKVLSEKPEAAMEAFYEQIIKSDSAYISISEALKALSAINPNRASELAKNMKEENNMVIQEGISAAIAGTDDPSNIDYFEQKLSENPSLSTTLMDKYINLVMSQNIPTMYDKAGFLFKQAIRSDLDKNSKFFFVKGIYEIKDEILNAALNQEDLVKKKELESKVTSLKSWIAEIKYKEQDQQIKKMLSQFN